MAGMGDTMSWLEAEREEGEDLVAWAREHAPDLLPEDETDQEAWHGVLSAIRSAKHTADWVARNPEGADFSYQPGDPF